MVEKRKRHRQFAGRAVGGLLAVVAAASALMGCSSQQETNATGSSAVASTESAGSPRSEAEEQDQMLRVGMFVDGEHSTSGTVRLVQEDGSTILKLDEDFTTSTSGPDLVVALHRSGDVIGSTTPPAFPLKEGDYVVLAPLESYSGAQSYAVPAEIQTEDFESAVIWCRRFNATFGAARLDSRP